MRFSCPCQARVFDVADEKLPPGPRFSLICPDCGRKFLVERAKPGQAGTYLDEPGDIAKSAVLPVAPSKPLDIPRSAARTIEPERFPAGKKGVMLALEDGPWRAAALVYLAEQGYAAVLCEDFELGAAKLRVSPYVWLIAQDGGQYAPLSQEIARWSGKRRRELNFTLLGQFTSLDEDAAFLHSANAVLGLGEADQAGRLLAEAEKVYQAYLARNNF